MSGKHSRNQDYHSDSHAVMRTLAVVAIIWTIATTFLLGYMIA